MPIINIECSMRRGANIGFRIRTKIKRLLQRPISSSFNFPIIINNFNRLAYLRKQIEWLEHAGYRNIYIIDNNSTYAPLLKYYRTLPYTVYRLNKNQGHFSLWETVIFMKFSNDYYVYTDPDILPVEYCPSNILEYFREILQAYPTYHKAGFALKIDDIPEHFNLKHSVIKWEQQFWKTSLDLNIYDALIDTTFALYRPGSKGGANIMAIRTAGKYMARHLPWYENSDMLDDETINFLTTSSSASSWYATSRGENKQYFE